jgi:Uma2 family endonuclease
MSLSVEQYHELIRTGRLTEDDAVELLEGRLVPKMPKNPEHRLSTGLLRQALEGIVPSGWYVDSQEPITLPDGEPEPDVVVVRGQRRNYTACHPGPGDLALVVEVSNTTLEKDRTEKLRSYARDNIPVYWILNLCDRRLEVYSDPSGPTDQPRYGTTHCYSSKDKVPVVIEKVEVNQILVEILLP